MNRDDLLALCSGWAGDRVTVGRVTVAGGTVNPIAEIMRCFRRAEISESEKNALLSLVCDPEEEVESCAETACVRDVWADEHEGSGDDD